MNAIAKVRVTGEQSAEGDFHVALDGRPYIELDDAHIAGAGAVGVWTKADSVTVFDDFDYGARQ